MTDSTDRELTPREEYEQAHATFKAMHELINSRGWKMLMQVADAQKRAREIANGSPMMKLDDVFERQLRSGEVLGISLLSVTPESMMDEAQAVMDQLKDQVKADG